MLDTSNLCTKGDSLHQGGMSGETLCPRTRCPGGTFCTGGHLALRHRHLLQAMKAGQGPENEASQAVFGISLTTISPAHNTFNHWHHEHYTINMAGICYHSNYIVFVITLFLLLFNNHTQNGRAGNVPLCVFLSTQTEG